MQWIYIIFTRKAMSSESGPLQVVPEVDIDSMDTKCGGNPSPSQESDPTSFNSKTDDTAFSQDCPSADGQEINKQCKVVRGGRRRSSVHPPVQRINYDAVPLTTAEVEAHQQIFSQNRP